MDAVIHIHRIFCTQATATVAVGHLYGEDVGIGAVLHVVDLQNIAVHTRGVCAVTQVAVGQHPLVGNRAGRRVVAVDVGVELEGRAVANQRVALDHNRRVRIRIHRRVLRGRAALDVGGKHHAIDIRRGVAVNGHRAVVQHGRVGAGYLNVVAVPLVAAALERCHRGAQGHLAAGTDHRSVQAQLNRRRADHMDRVHTRHRAAGGRLHHIHFVDAVVRARVHRQRAARAARNRRPVVLARTGLLGPLVDYVLCVVVAKVRRERHLAAFTQRVNRRGHFHEHRVVHIHIVRFARHTAARLRHLRRDRIDIRLVRSSAGYHHQRVALLDDVVLANGQVAVVQSPIPLQTAHVVVDVIDVRIQRHRVVALCVAQNRVAADLQRRLRNHPHRVERLH